MQVRVRVASPRQDADRVAEIYGPYVSDSVVSFEEVPPTTSEMAERIQSVLAWTPWLVAEDDNGRVIGYAYGSRHRDRPGYRWSVDVSVYVDASWQRQGVGRALYADLIALLRRQRFVNVYAGIALPNDGSVALHEAIGMTLIGVYERVGYKLGSWPDVAWYGMRLQDPGADPPEPIPFPDLPER